MSEQDSISNSVGENRKNVLSANIAKVSISDYTAVSILASVSLQYRYSKAA